MDYLRRKNYEMVSAGAAAVESIAKPVAQQTHRLMVEGSETVYAGVVSVLDQVEKGTDGKLTWVIYSKFTNPLKQASRWMQQTLTTGLEYHHDTAMQTWDMIEAELTQQQESLEKEFREKGVEIGDNWAFSSENRMFIRQIGQFIEGNTADCQHMQTSRVWQYLIAYAILQNTALTAKFDLLYEPETPPIDQLLPMSYFSKYAVGIYGKFLVNCLMKSRKLDLFLAISDEEILCEHANITSDQLLYRHFDSSKHL